MLLLHHCANADLSHILRTALPPSLTSGSASYSTTLRLTNASPKSVPAPQLLPETSLQCARAHAVPLLWVVLALSLHRTRRMLHTRRLTWPVSRACACFSPPWQSTA
eukprot:6176409-Pleurochrysis_carterae.AAC.3